jgi:hypothetical protein
MLNVAKPPRDIIFLFFNLYGVVEELDAFFFKKKKSKKIKK